MTHKSSSTYINHAGIACSLGVGLSVVEDQLFKPDHNNCDFFTVTDAFSPSRAIPLGLVTQTLSPLEAPHENTQTNRLLVASMQDLLPQIEDLKSRYGAHRIGIIVGTSTSGIAEGEAALVNDNNQYSTKPGYQYKTQEMSGPARFLSRWLGLSGPCWTHSSACTSGGKAVASAERLLTMGACDAIIAAGVDSLCRMTVAGFSSLLVVTDTQCNPFSRNRNGINIGEGAASFIISKAPGPVRLAGVGESSDAYHISSPDPDGKGAEKAMRAALTHAQLNVEDIDYINLHGTATSQNDSMEAGAVNRVFGPDVPCSSTKPFTGHTLAAAGAIEALFCWLLLQRQDNLIPPHRWDGESDPTIATLNGLACSSSVSRPRAVLSNSFAFGGNNLSLVLTRE